MATTEILPRTPVTPPPSQGRVTPSELEEQPSYCSSSIHRDEEFWFEDGNLTLCARNIEFRIYRGPIIARSRVLKELISESLSSNNAETSSCCNHTVVSLTESPEDVRLFLRALVPGSVVLPLSGHLTFEAISACIRLGRKYEVDDLVQRSLAYLKKYYVEGFDDWTRYHPLRPPQFKPVDSIGVVGLARLTDTILLLPVALMGCCYLEPMELLRGMTLPDGTVEQLSQEDLCLILSGRVNLINANANATVTVFAQTLSEDCIRPDVCAPLMLTFIDQLRNHQDILGTMDWFKYWDDYVTRRDGERRLCPHCYDMIKEREKDAHRDVWRRLPGLMGVTIEDWIAHADTSTHSPDPVLPDSDVLS